MNTVKLRNRLPFYPFYVSMQCLHTRGTVYAIKCLGAVIFFGKSPKGQYIKGLFLSLALLRSKRCGDYPLKGIMESNLFLSPSCPLFLLARNWICFLCHALPTMMCCLNTGPKADRGQLTHGLKQPELWVKPTSPLCKHMGICVSVPFVCLVPVEARRGCCTPWNWSYRCLWATLWVLELKLGSSKTSSALNHRVLSPEK